MRGSKRDAATSRDRVARSTFIVLERTRQGKCKKFYAYNVEQIQLAEPKVITVKKDKNGNPLSARESAKAKIQYKYKTVARLADLPSSYVEAKMDAKKKSAAAKRAKIAKENGEPVKKRKPAAKKEKKSASPKKEKKAKKSPKAKAANKKETIDSIIAALSGKKVAAKKSPKPRKTKAAKKGGSGYCSFF